MSEWTKERHDRARRLCAEQHDDASIIAEELPAALDHIEEMERGEDFYLRVDKHQWKDREELEKRVVELEGLLREAKPYVKQLAEATMVATLTNDETLILATVEKWNEVADRIELVLQSAPETT